MSQQRAARQPADPSGGACRQWPPLVAVRPGRPVLDSVAEHLRTTAAMYEQAARRSTRRGTAARSAGPGSRVRCRRIHALYWVALVMAGIGFMLQLTR